MSDSVSVQTESISRVPSSTEIDTYLIGEAKRKFSRELPCNGQLLNNNALVNWLLLLPDPCTLSHNQSPLLFQQKENFPETIEIFFLFPLANSYHFSSFYCLTFFHVFDTRWTMKSRNASFFNLYRNSSNLETEMRVK